MSATTFAWYCPHCGKRQDGGRKHYVIEHEEYMDPLVYGLCDECIIKHHRWMEGEDNTHQGSGTCLDCSHYLGVKNDKSTLGFDEYCCDIPRGDDEPRRIMCKDGYRCSRYAYNGTGPIHGKVYKGAKE